MTATIEWLVPMPANQFGTDLLDRDRRVDGRFTNGSLSAGETSNPISGFTGQNPPQVLISKGTLYTTMDPIANIQDETAEWHAPDSEQAAAKWYSLEPTVTGVKIEAPAGSAATWRASC